MWSWEKFLVTIGLGVSILGSYVWMVTRAKGREFFGRLLGSEPWALGYWTGSAVLTAISWLWLLLYWVILADPNVLVWGYGIDEFRDSIVFPALTVFLVSALCWAPLTVYCHERQSWTLRILITAVLWVTALASVALFAMAAGTRVRPGAGWSTTECLLSLAGGMVAFHHVIWDACVWDATWDYASASLYNTV